MKLDDGMDKAAWQSSGLGLKEAVSREGPGCLIKIKIKIKIK
jgi:hypothetical protein